MQLSIRHGFYVAAAFNVLGIGVTTRAFTADPLSALYPGLFSMEGCILIAVWGLAYAAAAARWREVPGLCAVFALEKLFYGASWIRYWSLEDTPSWADHAADHPDAVLFLTTYGAGDLLFAAFFGFAAWRAATRRA